MTFLKKTQSPWILFAIPGYLAKPHIIYSVFKFLLQEAYHPGLGKEYATLGRYTNVTNIHSVDVH